MFIVLHATIYQDKCRQVTSLSHVENFIMHVMDKIGKHPVEFLRLGPVCQRCILEYW